MDRTFNLNSFNAFLQKAQETISCDQECQRQKTEQQLKDKYQSAQANLMLAEPQYEVAKQAYYTYVDGPNGYSDMLEKELDGKASQQASKFRDTIQNAVNKIESDITTYNGILINYSNLVDLYQQYVRDNATLEKQYKDNANDVLTNERKTFYENQQIGRLNMFYKILWVVYIVVVLAFFAVSMFRSSNTSLTTRMGMGVFFVILPFFSTWLLGMVVYLSSFLFNLLPKNVYK